MERQNIIIYNTQDAKASEIENRIFNVRNVQVMLDSHLGELYGVETKLINKAVKRNEDRFPEEFMFQLTDSEWKLLTIKLEKLTIDQNLRFQNGTSRSKHGGRRYLPFVFTEQGVAMLSVVLKSHSAVKTSIQIMNAFVGMRKILNQNAGLLQRLDKVETKLLDNDIKFEAVFKALEKHDLQPQKGIFFDGEVFDAWTFVSDLVRSAQSSLVLIDNYLDDRVLKLFNKRKQGVTVNIYTKTINKQLLTDLEKHNQQYDAITIIELKTTHDRFLIIDNAHLYHIGASLKDLGSKWFAFSKMNDEANKILNLIIAQL